MAFEEITGNYKSARRQWIDYTEYCCQTGDL